jgi:hypothetical protein
MLPVIAAIALTLFIIVATRWSGNEVKASGYPFILTTFPLVGVGFALYVNDSTAVIKEFIYGIPFFAIAILAALFLKNRIVQVLLILGYAGHAAYDAVNHSLLINPGIPDYWPVFCGLIDILLAAYLTFVFFISGSNRNADSVPLQ